jgi:hypothetical protein
MVSKPLRDDKTGHFDYARIKAVRRAVISGGPIVYSDLNQRLRFDFRAEGQLAACNRVRLSACWCELDIHLLNRTDLPSAGAGEAPIIALAPAIGNAVFHATGVRLREMPMRWNANRTL